MVHFPFGTHCFVLFLLKGKIADLHPQLLPSRRIAFDGCVIESNELENTGCVKLMQIHRKLFIPRTTDKIGGSP